MYKKGFVGGLIVGKAILAGMIGTALLLHQPHPVHAKDLLSNGYFIGYSSEQRFEVHFDDAGELLVSGPSGSFEGKWALFGDSLCVVFESGPRAGRNCAAVSHEGPLSLRVGDHLFLAKLADVVGGSQLQTAAQRL